jgi:hypothetical protein
MELRLHGGDGSPVDAGEDSLGRPAQPPRSLTAANYSGKADHGQQQRDQEPLPRHGGRAPGRLRTWPAVTTELVKQR